MRLGLSKRWEDEMGSREAKVERCAAKSLTMGCSRKEGESPEDEKEISLNR